MNTGKWIYYHTGDKKRPDSIEGNPSPYFRKEFRVRGKVLNATLSVATVGVFKAFLNGINVSDEYFSSGRCDFNKRIPVFHYDVTELLKDENAIGIICGDGWAIGSMPFFESVRRNCFSDEIYLWASLKISYEDGAEVYINTDNTWKVSSGKIRYSSMYFGECVDSNFDLTDGFSEFGFNDTSWKNAYEDIYSKSYLICDFEGVEIRKLSEIKPVKVLVKDGFKVYDFGKVISGTVTFEAKGNKNDTVRVYYALDSEKNNFDTFILSGKASDIFETGFSVHKFRFVWIDSSFDIKEITAFEIAADALRTGDFYCSDNRLTEIFVNSYRDSKAGFLSIPETDGFGVIDPDKAIFDMYTFDCRKLYKKFLSDIRDAQFANGFVPTKVPVMQYGYRKIPGEFSGDAPIKIVYNYFMMYGDIEVLKENLEMCKKLCMYIENTTEDLLTLSSVYMYMSVICSAIGDFDAKLYREKYTSVKLEFRKGFDGHTTFDEQRDYVEGFITGILTADEVRQPLLNSVKRGDDVHPELLKVLCEIGESSKAFELVSTSPKDFSGYADLSWYFSGILGIKPDSTPEGAGYKKMTIEPSMDLSDNIRKAGGSIVTPFGKISVYWEKNDDIYTCCLTVPFEIDATVRFSGFKVINQKCSRETYVFSMRKVIR